MVWRLYIYNLFPNQWYRVFYILYTDFPLAKLTNRTLYMQVFDYDRFSRDEPIGEVCLPLNDLDFTSGHQTFWRSLQPCKGHAVRIPLYHRPYLLYGPMTTSWHVTIYKELASRELISTASVKSPSIFRSNVKVTKAQIQLTFKVDVSSHNIQIKVYILRVHN